MTQGCFWLKWQRVFVGLIALIFSALALASAPPAASLTGELSVTPGGSANYQLPLLTPPGKIKPSLSLQYSSQAGNGPLGMGWSLGGLSQLSRCPRVKTIDGIDDGVLQFNANDRLCLDGQRLILVSGTYGGNNAEYRTKIDSDLKIVGKGSFDTSTAWFEVRTPDGQIMEYGRTSNSRRAITPTGNDISIPTLWAVNRVADRFTNYYLVSYLLDSGVLYPLTISYSGNNTSGMLPERVLTFNWSQNTLRPDVLPAYIGGGVSVQTRYILTEISNNANLARYKLSYSLSEGRQSNLTSIKYCIDNADSNCLDVKSQYGFEKDPLTGMRMTDSELILEEFGLNQGWRSHDEHPRHLADVNGDGVPDIVGFGEDGVWVSFGTNSGFTNPVKTLPHYGRGAIAGGWTSDNIYPRLVADINGDGLSDIIGFSGEGVKVSLSTGTGFTNPEMWIRQFGRDHGWTSQEGFPRFLADVNGDGLLDIFGFGGSDLRIGYNRRGHFDDTTFFTGGFTPREGWYNNSDTPRYVVDINGDGLADIVGLHENGVYSLLATPFGYDGSMQKHSPGVWADRPSNRKHGEYRSYRWRNGSTRTLADINGDGLLDIIGFDIELKERYYEGVIKPPRNREPYPHSVLFSAFISINEGGAFSPQSLFVEIFPETHKMTANAATNFQNSFLEKNSILIVDANFDGLDDFVQFNTDDCSKLFISTGSSVRDGECLVSNFKGSNELSAGSVVIDDLLGNNTFSLLGFTKNGVRVSHSKAKNPNQIIGFMDNLSETYIDYSTLVDSTIYSKGSGSTFPIAEIQTSMSVVKSILNTDGIGGTSLTRYRYGGLRSHFDHGSLGFQWIETLNSGTGHLDYSEFIQTYPLTGSLYRTQSQHCTNLVQIPWEACQVLSQEVSDWSFSETGGTVDRKIYRPYINKTTEHSWLISSGTP